MFDFRYHALSLVAVFLALGIGILLGATIGDSLVSSADRGLRSSLAADLERAREEAREEREQIERRDRLIAAVLPRLVVDRLSGQGVAVVASGSLPGDVEAPVREAVEVAGGTIDSVSTLDVPADAAEVAQALDGGSARTAESEAGLEALGRRVARAIVIGGRAPRALERALPDRFRGDFQGADAIVVFRSPPDEPEGESEPAERRLRQREAFEDALVESIRQTGVRAVGVEHFDNDPTQVPWYEQQDIEASVDSVDLAGGQLALVYTLDGAEGAFGFKGTADRAVPELAGPDG